MGRKTTAKCNRAEFRVVERRADQEIKLRGIAHGPARNRAGPCRTSYASKTRTYAKATLSPCAAGNRALLNEGNH